MNQWELMKHKAFNFLQTAALSLLMAVLLKYLASLIGGGALIWMAVLTSLGVYLVNQVFAPHMALFLTRARPLKEYEAPEIFRNLRMLSERAGLQHIPRLYYLPTDMMNAFAIGRPENASIALSKGLLRYLNSTEIAGVLAHELSHIKHHDIRVMGLVDMTSRLTKMLSWLGQFYLLFSLPLILFGQIRIDVFPVLLLIAAPILSDLIQLALSRVREFNADLGAATLLGRPEPLASALQKMERYQTTLLDRLVPFRRKEQESVLLRTHPPTQERIQRLLKFRSSTAPMTLSAVTHRYPLRWGYILDGKFCNAME